jgi:Flp pilus assembly protein TadG
MAHTEQHRQSRFIHTVLSDESGSNLVEFAVATTVLLMLIFGIMDCSRLLYSFHYVSSSARDATRYAMVRGSSWNNASCSNVYATNCTAGTNDVSNYVWALTPFGFSADRLSVNTTWPGTTANGSNCSSTNVINSPGCVVSVKVSYSYNFMLPFLPRNTLLLTSTSKVSIQE